MGDWGLGETGAAGASGRASVHTSHSQSSHLVGVVLVQLLGIDEVAGVKGGAAVAPGSVKVCVEGHADEADLWRVGRGGVGVGWGVDGDQR